MKTGCMCVAHSPHFLDNGIIHGSVSKSSSGVQRIGALNPLLAQIDSIRERMAALAKCRQFHVKR
jgi:hypothetical protein